MSGSTDESRIGSTVWVLVVDDVRLNRDSLVEVLQQERTIAGAVGAANSAEALVHLDSEGCEVVLLSMTTAHSLRICQELAARTPVVALAVSGSDDDEMVACAEAGVAGYVMRDQAQDVLVEVIATAARGETSCPPQVASALMRRMGPRGSRPAPAGAARLTAREREILILIDDGMSNKEIARKLCIEVRTVKNHVHNLLEKLSVHRRGEAAALVRGHRDPYRV